MIKTGSEPVVTKCTLPGPDSHQPARWGGDLLPADLFAGRLLIPNHLKPPDTGNLEYNSLRYWPS